MSACSPCWTAPWLGLGIYACPTWTNWFGWKPLRLSKSALIFCPGAKPPESLWLVAKSPAAPWQAVARPREHGHLGDRQA